MTPTAELVEYLARRLVEKPDEVRVEEEDEDGDLVIRLHVAPEDIGRVIAEHQIVDLRTALKMLRKPIRLRVRAATRGHAFCYLEDGRPVPGLGADGTFTSATV